MIEVLCVRSNKNTGKSDCPFNPALTKGFFLAPVANCKITAANRADQDTLKAFINAQLQHNNPALRWHYIGPLEDLADKSEAPAIQTLPNGTQKVTDRGHSAGEYQILEGGKYYHQSLLSFNHMEEYFRVFPHDIKNVLQGTEDVDVATTMTGYTPSALFAFDYKPATKTTVPEYKGLVAYADAAEMNENYFAIKCDFQLAKLKGVQDISFENVTPGGAADGIHHIKIWGGGKTINLVEQLGSAIATATNFITRNKDTGAAINKTTALNAAGDAVVITCSLADADYVDGDLMEILWTSVSQGGDNGCKWFETPKALEVEMREA